MLDSRKASKLAIKIWMLVDDFCVSHDLPLSASSLHRKRKARDDHELATATKVARAINNDLAAQDAKDEAPTETTPATAMTADQIRSMMSNTLKQIEQRKRQLGDIKGGGPEVISAKVSDDVPPVGKPALVGPQKPMPAPPKVDDKAATIAALQVSTT